MILGFVILGKQLPESAVLWRSTVPEWLICISWISSLLLLRKFQDKSKGAVNDSDTGFTKKSAILWLVIISIVVLIFGVLLEETSDTIASHFEINGIIFVATILALVTSLPEISGGLAFVKERSYQPIISDIFGGNAFLPVLFLVASLISNNPILPKAQIMDIYLTGVAMIITTIYVVGIILNFQTRKRGLGRDSWLVLVVYILSLVGMFFI
jgi:cation:H+ antiporter